MTRSWSSQVGRTVARGSGMAAFFAVLGALALAPPRPVGAATPPPLVARHGAVASDHPLASAAGVAALKAGGNAVDAACATALALGVTNPFNSGIGGGGFALVYVAAEKKVHVLDFREKAPAAIKPDLFLDAGGKFVPERSTVGGLAVAVPGEVRGLGELVKRWGKRPFARCVDEALRLARTGVPVTRRLHEGLESLASKPPPDPAFRQIFLPGGKALAEGVVLKRPDLAATLATLQKRGPDAFYKGPIADAIVRAVKAAGGVLEASDLAAYAVADRTALETTYRGLRVFTMPPASSGGIAMAEMLGTLQARGTDLRALGAGSSATWHLLAEAMKHAFADRARFLGDSDFVKVPLAHLASAAYHRQLAARIKDDGVLGRDAYGTKEGDAALLRDGGTTHLSVIDADGNAVALTSTINLGFGAKLVAGATGILLNDQIDDFSVVPGVANAFGLVGNAQNAVAPGKRPLSSMSPTVVLDDAGVKLVVGAAGGPTIITATTLVLMNVVDFGMDAAAAVAAPRVHHQWVPEVLTHESDVPADVRTALEKRGHKLRALPRIGVVNLVVRTDRGLEAASDPRSVGAPAGY